MKEFGVLSCCVKLSERFGVSNVQWCHSVKEFEVWSVCIEVYVKGLGF